MFKSLKKSKKSKGENTSCEVQEAYRWLQETFGGCHHINDDSTIILPFYQQKAFQAGVTTAKNLPPEDPGSGGRVGVVVWLWKGKNFSGR